MPLASGSSRSSGGSGSPVLAGEPIHPYAVTDQINFEWSSRDCSRSLAAQRFSTFPFRFLYANGILKDEARSKHERQTQANFNSEVNGQAAA